MPAFNCFRYTQLFKRYYLNILYTKYENAQNNNIHIRTSTLFDYNEMMYVRTVCSLYAHVR